MKLYAAAAAGFAILVISIISNIIQFQNYQRVAFLRTISEERARINDDQLKENLMIIINDLRLQNIENAKGQGKIEGIIAAVNNMKLDETNEYHAVWHAGYYAGTGTAELQNASAYEEGYHKAIEDGNCPRNSTEKSEKIIPASNKPIEKQK